MEMVGSRLLKNAGWFAAATALLLLASPVSAARPGAKKKACPDVISSLGAGWEAIQVPEFPTHPNVDEPGFVPREWQRIGVIEVDHWNDKRIFVSNGATVLRTTDGGCTWAEVFDTYTDSPQEDVDEPPQVTSIHVTNHGPDGGDRVYLTFSGPSQHPVVVSNDGGDSWSSPAGTGLPPVRTGDVILEPTLVSPGVLYYYWSANWHGSGAFNVSDDGGESWEQRSAPDSDPAVVTQTPYGPLDLLNGSAMLRGFVPDPGDGDTVWGYDRRHILGTTDGGVSWDRLTPAETVTGIHAVTKNGTVTVGAAVRSEKQLWLSRDGWKTWDRIPYPEGAGDGSSQEFRFGRSDKQLFYIEFLEDRLTPFRWNRQTGTWSDMAPPIPFEGASAALELDVSQFVRRPSIHLAYRRAGSDDRSRIIYRYRGSW
ncbi:MAG: hypothetical protein ACRDLB_16885 [Actinomycetota bacterium]